MTIGKIDPICALHGMRWSEHEHGRCIYCVICGEDLTDTDKCFVDGEGQKWDMCAPCGLAEAGIF